MVTPVGVICDEITDVFPLFVMGSNGGVILPNDVGR